MAQYIDKAALVAEIERKIKEINLDIIKDWRNRIQREHDIEVMKNILSLIDTIEVKEVDLESEITLWENAIPEIRLDDVERLATYFFELGLKAQKGE